MRRIFAKRTRTNTFAFSSAGVVASCAGYQYFTLAADSAECNKQNVTSGMFAVFQDALRTISLPFGDRSEFSAFRDSSSSETLPQNEQATRNGKICYVFDPVASKLNFKINHLVCFPVDGSFSGFQGAVEISWAQEDNEISNIAIKSAVAEAEVDAATIDTRNWLRDRRMRNEFLEVHKYPKLMFKGTGWRQAPPELPSEQQLDVSTKKQGGVPDEKHSKTSSTTNKSLPVQTYKALGKVCIRNVWKDVELDVQIQPYNVMDCAGLIHDPITDQAADQISAKVRGRLNRFDFGVLTNWPESAVGKDINLDFHIVANVREAAQW